MFKKYGLKAFMDKFAVVATNRPDLALRSLLVKSGREGFDPIKVTRAYERRREQWLAKQARDERRRHNRPMVVLQPTTA